MLLGSRYATTRAWVVLIFATVDVRALDNVSIDRMHGRPLSDVGLRKAHCQHAALSKVLSDSCNVKL